jgi:glutamate dehydrogenase
MEAARRFMAELEQRGRLDRAVEGLPDALAMAERTKAGEGLTRPELAVLLAYGKLDLKRRDRRLLGPGRSLVRGRLKAYFPPALRKYEDEMKRHRLRREIIATVVDNTMVNMCGPTFPAGCGPRRLRRAALVAGFEAARKVLGADALWARSTPWTARPRPPASWPVPGHRRGPARPDLLAGPPRPRRLAQVQTLVDAYAPAALQGPDAADAGDPRPVEQKAFAKRAKAFVRRARPRPWPRRWPPCSR